MLTNELVLDVAREALACFREDERPDGSRYVVTAQPPRWVWGMVGRAHGSMLEDNHVYRWTRDAVDFIVGGLSAAVSMGHSEYISSVDECVLASEFADVPHTERQQVEWLASHVDRLWYCDRASVELGLGPDVSMFNRLGAGIAYERDEIFHVVWSAIMDEAEDRS